MTYRLTQLQTQGLPPLLAGVESPTDWEAKRHQIEAVWLDVIGGLPPRLPPSYQVLSETELAEHTRLHLTYATAGGDQVTAFLLLPHSPPTAGQLPAVLALHPTANEGKADVATPEGRVNRQYGLELVRRGFVVLAPDAITAGERVYPGVGPYCTAPFDQAHPEWSAVGKMLLDHLYGVDLLCALPMVDSARIGAIGHSLGAYNGFFLAGIDRRVRAVVSSCGLSPFAGDPEQHRWGKRDWFSHLPRLSEAIALGWVPFELHEIAALCAPTPFFNYFGQSDQIFPHWQQVAAANLELARLYEWLGFGERYVGLMGAGGHDFPQPIRRMAYDFLEHWLVKEAP